MIRLALDGDVDHVEGPAPRVDETLLHAINAIVVQAHEPLSGRIEFKRNFADSIGYSANGHVVANIASADNEFNLLLCDSRGDREAGGGLAAGRWINVRDTGRPRIYAQRAEVQAMLGGCQ